MGVYAVTGAASGMGAASADRLRAAGHTVITVDLKEADVVADLSTPAGRSAAVRRTLERAGNRLDGAVLAAGLGPVPGKEHTLAQVNVRGVIELLEGWRPALAAAGNSKVVVFGSNSTTTTPAVPMSAVRAFLAGDLEKGVRRAGRIRPAAAPFTYAASKIAVTHWVRRNAVTPDWAGAGIRLNVLAPGAVSTPPPRHSDREPGGRSGPEFPRPDRGGSVSRTGLPSGWSSCCPRPPTSSSARSWWSTAAARRGSVPSTGRDRCRCGRCCGTCGGCGASAADRGLRPPLPPRSGPCARPIRAWCRDYRRVTGPSADTPERQVYAVCS